MKRYGIICLSILLITAAASCSSKKGSVGNTLHNYSPSADRYAPRKKVRKESFAERKTGASENESDAKTESQNNRMIIYTASYKIKVMRVQDAVTELKNLSERLKGFIESSRSSDSYRYARVVLRVPVARFDEALKAVEKIGKVTEKKMSASDVTRAYHDASLRINTAKQVRKRLYQLLARTKKIKQRVEILREIERLTTQIESLTSKMTYLKNRASYSTIVVAFRAAVRESVTRYTPSPFKWIASLNFNRRSVFKEYKRYAGKTPSGFFHMKEDYYKKRNSAWLYAAPDNNAFIRISTVKNFPQADLAFWKEALKIDFANRNYTQLEQKSFTAGEGLIFEHFVLKTGEKIYSVSCAVREKTIIIVEALFKTEDEYKKNKDTLEKYIKSVRKK